MISICTEEVAMFQIAPLIVTIMILFVVNPVHSEESSSNSQKANDSTSTDLRQLVSMPEQTRQIMREEMLNHLSALSEIISQLASNNLDAAFCGFTPVSLTSK